jgi:hypothetical protein
LLQYGKKSIETYVFYQYLGYAILAGLGLSEGKEIWGGLPDDSG